MNKISNQFASIEQVTDQYLNRKSTEASYSESSISFEEILKQKQDVTGSSELKFSKHASMRLNDRHINLSQEQNERLENGVLKASAKGINESLVILDSLAFIVNVPNRTVVTAIDQSESNDNIFTNIDGAVIV
ncbi:MAG: flagellar protein [Clostridiales bacterium]|nr:flagellar protein [Roseburia sp.]MDD7637067.1 flagellar protein [Clostridiales bacterium]MDY4112411.1 TIGR02530 family flagellar biosynthesis protein [Roseburia sp.]